MARVFLAHETALGRRVVVKVLSPTLAAGVSADRFRREILLVAKLQHPHIVPVHAAGELGGLPYFTMPFVEGESLRARLTREGELPISEVLRLLRDVASALAYAHAQGVIHRDIKPDNVLLSVGSAIVADFGVAKALSEAVTDGEHSHLTSLGIALGTPAYMAPEQASADPAMDHRVDIYAFGVMAYEMLAGRPPFVGRSPQALFAAHVNEPPVPVQALRPSVPPSLAALVMRCLEKHAADRPTQADDLLHMLDAMTTPSGGNLPTTELPAHRQSWPTTVPTEPVKKPPPWPQIAVAATALAAVLAALVILPRRDQPAAAVADGARAAAPVDSQASGGLAVPPADTALRVTAAPPPPAPVTEAPARTVERTQPRRVAEATAPVRQPAAPDTTVMARLRTSALEARRGAVAAGASADRIADGDTAMARAESLRRAGRIDEAALAFSSAGSQWIAATAAANAARRPTPPDQVEPQPQRQAEPPAAPPEPPADPRPAIEAAVAEYATAIESRSTARIRRANPGLTDAQEQDWRQFFDAIGAIQVSLRITQLQVTDDVAEAALAGTYVFENTTTRRTDQQPVAIRMSLRRVGGVWRVTGIR